MKMNVSRVVTLKHLQQLLEENNKREEIRSIMMAVSLTMKSSCTFPETDKEGESLAQQQ